MQYKDSPKIMIDERKLEILFRLGCPDAQIIELLKTKKFTPTGDSLIDQTLESLVDYRVFENWGGFRIGSGRKPKNSGIKNQDDNQDENQVDNQDANQVVDKDNNILYINNNNSRNLIPDTNTQDNNIYYNNNLENKETSKERKDTLLTGEEDRTLEIQFNSFWEVFPKTRKAGKTKPRQKFFQIVKSKQATAEQLIKAAEEYAKTDTVARGFAKEPYSWLLNERYLCDYSAQEPVMRMNYKEMKQFQNEIALDKIRKGEA